MFLKVYKLDPAYFVATPSLAFQAMLKVTKAEIETFTDIDMILMAEKEIRGGLTQVIKKHAVANNKYLPDYEGTKKSVFLQYLDANNLYGYGMSKKLPLKDYKWADSSMITEEFIKNYDENSDTGYLLKADVEYPKELASAHRDLSFLPKRRFKKMKKFKHEVTKEIEKGHRKVYKQIDITHITHEPENNKLIATIQYKDKHVVCITSMKQTLKHRLKLKKVHRVISYYQSNWLKVYIDKNNDLRKHAKNEFEKHFFKLMNNSVFGKLIENVRKRRNIKLVVSEERRKKLASDPNYKVCTTFSDELIAIEMRKTHIVMNKPIIVGEAILDKGKELMYSFYYEYLKPKFKDNLQLLYMDTDSFVFEIETDDFFKETKFDLKEY